MGENDFGGEGMRLEWKKWKKKARKLLQRPGAKWVLAAAGGVLLAVIALIVLSSLRVEKPITEGNTTTVTLVAGGDLVVSDKTIAAGGEEYDYGSVFLDVARVFAEADAAVLNFEGNFCGEPYGSALCSAPRQLARQLKEMGVDFLQIANSCTIRNGINGLQDTLEAISEAEMVALGAYASNTEAAKQQGFYLCSVKGVKIAFVAFTKGMDGMRLPAGYEKCVNLLYSDYDSTYKKINTEGITSVLQAAKNAEPDVIIALVHWGSEESTTVSKSQQKIARLLLQNGVDAIIGSHPHQLQSVVYDESAHTLVAYSLGDFFGDCAGGGNQYSVLLQLEITKNWDSGKAAVTGWDYTPIYTLTDSRDRESTRVVRIAPALQAYEDGSVLAVGSTAYENMRAALAQIEKKLFATVE